MHSPLNICVETKIISILDSYNIEVDKKAVIKDVEIFKNLMLLISGALNNKNWIF